jgi:hypothetical protein
MFRRSIFLGLMVVLASVLVYMILSARKQEKRAASPASEIIRRSKPSATRVLSPTDLQVTASTMEIVHPPGAAGSVREISARQSITIRNTGSRPYSAVMLKLRYLAASGSTVETRSHEVSASLPAGETVTLNNMVMEGLPAKVKACNVSIVWADLAE